MRTTLGRAATAASLTLLLALGACSGDDGGSEGSGDDGADLQDRLGAAKTLIDEAESVDFEISTDSLPSGVKGLLEAEGTGTSAPAFDGTARVVVGSAVDAEVVSVDGTVHAKVGFTPMFVELDPASIGAPDPAIFFDTEEGVSSLLVATEDLEAGEQERDGEDVLTTVTGTLPGELLKAMLPTADEAGDFDVTYRLTDDDVLRSATISGPFYSGADDVTYDLTIEPSDEAVDITAP
jgi:lipoprotein LprG